MSVGRLDAFEALWKFLDKEITVDREPDKREGEDEAGDGRHSVPATQRNPVEALRQRRCSRPGLAAGQRGLVRWVGEVEQEGRMQQGALYLVLVGQQ